MLESSVCLLLLFLSHSAVTGQQTCSEDGAIQLIGIQTDNFAAGRLEICVDGTLRAVYDDSWGQREAILACTQLGFSEDGAIACTGSCLGASSLQQGYTGFTSCNNRPRILDCGVESNDGLFINNNAGVICTTGDTPTGISQCPTALPTDSLTPCPEVTTVPTPPPTTTCECTDCNMPNPATTEGQDLGTPPIATVTASNIPDTPITTLDTPPITSDTPSTTSESPAASTESSQERVETGNSCTAIGAALGVVCALLLLALVGVVMAWAWSYHRNRLAPKERASSTDLTTDNTLDNPTYSVTAGNTMPSVQYSSLGPADTPLPNHTHISQQEDAEYQEVQPEEGAAYEVPEGMTYEVPRAGPEEGVAYEVPLQSLKRTINRN